VREWKDLSSVTIKNLVAFMPMQDKNLHEGFIPAGNIAYVKFWTEPVVYALSAF
jgi:hypothetical protein